MRSSRKWSLFMRATVAAVLAANELGGQERKAEDLLTTAKYLDFEQVANPQISPDGSQILYTRRGVNKIEDRWESSLWIVNADGSRNRFLTKGGGAVWSPDGTRIAYLAEGEPQGAQVFVRWMDASGATSQVTRVDRAPADLKWSPDGQSIGFSMLVPKAFTWKIDMPEAPKGAKWTPAPRIVTTLHFRQDGAGFTDPGNRHLFVVTADGGTPHQITSGDWSVGSRFDALDGPVGWDWMPDGKSVVFEAFTDSTADLNSIVSDIYSVDLASHAMHKLTTMRGAWSSPTISPDGRRIAYRGHARITDSYHAAELYVMNADGSDARLISGDLDRDVADIIWSPDGGTVWFIADDRGTRQVYTVGPTGTGLRAITSGDHVIGNLSLASKALIAAAISRSYQSPPDVVRVTVDKRTSTASTVPVTHVNADLLTGVRLAKAERIRYTSTGAAPIDGWIIRPPDYDPARRYPLILEIHGGPHDMYSAGFNYSVQHFAANGYVVLITNPRGSTSYGSAFGNSIMHRFPGVDYDDLMAGVDAVIAKGGIDTTRMYVGGFSAGGVLSSWVIGHTNRFAAASVRSPITDWMSFYGQTDAPVYAGHFFDKPVWEDPQPWLRQSSLMYVGNVTTPTIVMAGVLDMRTPMPQSEELYAALKTRGVPSALIRFEGEYHGTTSKPSNFIRTQLYILSWYGRWRRPSTTASPVAAGM